MKEIRAIIRPSKLPKLRDALRGMKDFPGMTVSRVEGFGRSHGTGGGGLRAALNDFTEKVRIEIVAPDELAGPIVDLIVAHARTGQSGDGLVWVTEVERAVFVNKTVG
ncbi:MAG: P-II family nitrogen regulator [Betaproteobacteria bacterium]|nr:P-II family nitrogen regulator [Betaproteobacteria bacterium]